MFAVHNVLNSVIDEVWIKGWPFLIDTEEMEVGLYGKSWRAARDELIKAFRE